MATTMVPQPHEVVVGIDTHADTHVAVAITGLGALIGSLQIPTDQAGYTALERWANQLGPVACFGMEGAASYGACLARHLRGRGHVVLEVDRPTRRLRARKGKSDTIDAEAAARSVLGDQALGVPKSTDGTVEMIRTLRLARRSALKARTQASNQLIALVLTAPEDLRARLRDLPSTRLVEVASRLRCGELCDPADATRRALRHLARRHRMLTAEITDLDRDLAALVAQTAPGLLELPGVGTDVAGALLVAAGDNPRRLCSEAAFASLCGVAPVPASSGKTTRHRLSRAGDRCANNALWRIVIVRMGRDERTRTYVARRIAEGRSKKEIIRCLKRYVAREVYPLLAAS